MLHYFKLMRIHHYIKNLLIFFPLFFSQSILDYGRLTNALVGFCIFSLISSVVYIINDLRDVEKDMLHPKKRFRPIAGGYVSKKAAVFLAIGCLSSSAFIGYLFNLWDYGYLVLLYLLINLLYSWGFKNIPLVDVVILTSGFVLRIVYGACITDIAISEWLYLTVVSGAFFMGLGKRRNELKKISSFGETRSVLKQYTYEFLDKNMYVFLALSDIFYSLWAVNHRNEGMIYTVPLFILLLMKYSLCIEGDSYGDPVEVIVNDKFLLGLGGVYIGLLIVLLYS